MRTALILICCFAALVAAQEPTRPPRTDDGRCPTSGFDLVREGRCTLECIVRDPTTGCPTCGDNCRQSCPMVRCSEFCPEYVRDSNGCQTCECRPRIGDGTNIPMDDTCRINVTLFILRTRCRPFCVRRQESDDNNCLRCDTMCNSTDPTGNEDMDECGPTRLCDNNQRCFAINASAINRCEMRQPPNATCGRSDPRVFRDFEDDGRSDSDEDREMVQREESERRDRDDSERRIRSRIGGANDRTATRNLGRSANIDRECVDGATCGPQNTCQQRTNIGPCMQMRMNNRDNTDGPQCDDNGMFAPLQCRRQQSDSNMFRCYCARQADGEMVPGTERMNIRDRSDRMIPDCDQQVFRNCSVMRSGRRSQVSHGESFVPSDGCRRCTCNNGQMMGCMALPQGSCNRLNEQGTRSCQRGDTTVPHGMTMMIDDCNRCGCRNGRLNCTQVRGCRRGDEQLDEGERACERCRNATQRIVSGPDGRTFPSVCAALNCSRQPRDGVRNGTRSSEPVCELFPCRQGLTCVPLGGRTCNNRSGCTPDDRRMCVNRTRLMSRVPTQPPTREPNPADRDAYDEDDDDAVCGSDGNTYGSLSRMIQEGPRDIRALYAGRCDRPDCQGGQVCGSDRVAYENACILRAQSANARVDYTGDCMGRNMDRTTDEICQMVRENRRCNHTAENCRHRVNTTEGCCPVCGGVVTLAIDDDALDEHTRATGQDIDLDDFMSRMVRGGVIPRDLDQRCTLAATRTTTTRQSNIEITMDARNRDMDSEYCNQKSKEVAEAFNDPTADQPVQASFVLAATDTPVIAETAGAQAMMASAITLLAFALLSLLF